MGKWEVSGGRGAGGAGGKNQADEMEHLTEPSVAEAAMNEEMEEDKENRQACQPPLRLIAKSKIPQPIMKAKKTIPSKTLGTSDIQFTM